jgi:colanic acid biosynthesis glycosyl transferase WcaI
MRVILLNQFYAPDEAATAQILADLGEALARRGHAVVALCGDRSYADPDRRYAATETIAGVRVRRLRTTAFGRGSKLGRSIDYLSFYLRAAARLLFGERPDVVVALTTPPFIALAAIAAGLIRRFPVVFWSMDVYPDVAFELGALRRRSILGWLLRTVGRLLHSSADVIVALGETMAERLRADGGKNVVVVHNWADERADADQPSSSSILNPQSSIPLTVMYSGNMGMAHEFETSLRAAELLPEVRFVFAGSGPRRDEIEKRSGELALPNVEMRGYAPRERLAESLRLADVHLVTLRESMPGLLVPSKIYGILAAGRPVVYVGPQRGEIFEIVREGECGEVIATGDVQALAGAIRCYQADPTLVRRHGANARRLYEQKFTRATSVGKLMDEIERAAGGVKS